jgi:plastocyanin
MSKKIAYLAVAIILFAASALPLCFGQEEKNQSSAGDKTQTILIRGLAFSPSNLTVERGTTVVWLNGDYITYKIKLNSFESGNLTRGDTFSHTFNETGTYDYSEATRPAMKGIITVT